MENQKKKLTYADSGVDIDAGDAAVERIKTLARDTFNSKVLTGIGLFAGFYKPDFDGIEKPVLISSADGVGTKLKLAFMTGIHDTIGEDLVNHCVDDILVHGARPLFFLDYIGTGKLSPDVIADIVVGLTRGCKQCNMPLLGGETAEMPDFYAPGEYDLAGFIVGVVDESRIINGTAIRPNDVCLGLPSNGLHTNGYSLARKVAFEIARARPDDHPERLGTTVAQALMAVHRNYEPLVRDLLDRFEIHGMAHITGGGLPGNLARVLPADCDALLHKSAWPIPPVFQWLGDEGDLDRQDMYRAFNMGIGFVMVVPPAVADELQTSVNQSGEPIYRIGDIIPGNGKVKLKD
jgi:phosphoribosylformylglycinamidine cyclo-ligase